MRLQDNDEVTRIGGKLFGAANGSTKMAAMTTDNRASGVYFASMCAAGAMITCAQLIGRTPDGVDENSPREKQAEAIVSITNKDTVLLAALIAAHCFDGARTEEDSVSEGIETAYGADRVLEAIKDWEKLTGKNPDEFFHADILEDVRRQTEGAQTLKDLLGDRIKLVAAGSARTQ